MKRLIPAILFSAVALAACGGSTNEAATPVETAQADADNTATDDVTTEGIRLISAEDGAVIQSDPSDDLVILDVRTPEEFAEGHLEGAIMIDFYEDDFADRLAELDPDVPYLLYCRSGNRSGQTSAMMEELGFADVADVDGGILSWTGAGLPTVQG